MLKKIIIATSLSTLLFSQTLQEFKAQQTQGYKTYKKTQEDGFKAYQKQQMKAFDDYKKEVGAFWDKPKLSTKKEWVSYTKDKKTRTDVDFGNETIVVQTIAKNAKEAKRKLSVALAKAVTIDTKTAQEIDPLAQKLAKIKKPAGVVDAKIDAKPILSVVVFKKPPTIKAVRNYVNAKLKSKMTMVRSKKVRHSNVYSIVVKLPKDTMIKRSKVYYSEVKKNARKENLPMPLIFAIMHSESSFNPKARSHVPAFGLMQIVPRTAGIDSYRYLYKKKRLVTSNYLYNSSNNIKLGSAYLHILYYSYLKKIRNPDSRLYCAIAAYNTGSGNIAWAFNRNKNLTYRQKLRMSNAADDINALTPKQVYNKLLRNLKYDEPKHYLKRVSKRMSQYKKVYGL